ncbi:putative RNA-directed DNA polymerase [Helianthus annuus]|nr:putative RNA-directed DNA polymerase [Helianthus annuus]
MNFHKMVEIQFGKQIKRVRCDNGGEFTSNSMIDFYNKNGILLETTCPHTPQQNGVVERKHGHLLETARTLRFEANVPKRFWGECVLTAMYIINRLPSKVIKNKTPYELVWNQRPKYNHLKVFGCLAYYKNNNTKGDKFEARGRPGVFLGYLGGTNGYKVYDMESKKIVISRDVLFCENYFPFKITNGNEASNDNDEPIRLLSGLNYNMPTQSQIVEDNQGKEHNVTESSQAQEDNFEPTTPSDSDSQVIATSPTNEPNIVDPSRSSDTSEPRVKRNWSQPTRLNDYIVKLPPSVDNSQLASD